MVESLWHPDIEIMSARALAPPQGFRCKCCGHSLVDTSVWKVWISDGVDLRNHSDDRVSNRDQSTMHDPFGENHGRT